MCLAASPVSAATGQKAATGKPSAGQKAPDTKSGTKKAGAPAPVPALVAALPPSAPADVLRRVLLKPYAAVTGAALPDTIWDGASLDGLKGKPTDLVLVVSRVLASGC